MKRKAADMWNLIVDWELNSIEKYFIDGKGKLNKMYNFRILKTFLEEQLLSNNV